ncbi:MAG: PTS sugar transporter subunit IIA [Lentisphaerae bacterium]|nr:PTS sugar transporter subunit IIA [Lentisphaerota bacterium]
MTLSDLLTPSLVKVGLESADKDELFHEMVQFLAEAGRLPDRAEALSALYAREAKMSTGIAPAVAIPHGKLTGIRDTLVGLGTSPRGIAYQSLDGGPVHVVVMVFAEAGNPGPHIAALAEISRLFLVPGFTRRVQEARSPGEVLDLIRNAE